MGAVFDCDFLLLVTLQSKDMYHLFPLDCPREPLKNLIIFYHYVLFVPSGWGERADEGKMVPLALASRNVYIKLS